MNVDVIVIGQNYSTSLGIIKAVGEFGFSCGVVKTTTGKKVLSPELKSKYVKKYVFARKYNEGEILNRLLEFSSSKKKVLLPSDDYSSSFLDRHYNELSVSFYLPNAQRTEGCMQKYFDKSLQKEIAHQFGLSVPQTWTINTREKIETLHDVVFPCITKPQESIGSPKSFIRKCQTKEELMTVLNEILRGSTPDILIEQFVEIENEYTVSGVAYGGKVIIPAFMKKTRTGSGIHKGVTISGVVKRALDYQGTVEKLKGLVREMNIEGIFDIELFESKGRFFFNEINLRYGAAGYAVTKSGYNIPACFVNCCLGQQSDLSDNYIIEEKSFVSDKAALDSYSAGNLEWSELWRLLRDSDIRFLGKDDFGPYLLYTWSLYKTKLSKLVHRQ